jgi:subtilase family serine protease
MRRYFLYVFLAFAVVGVLFSGARKILAQSGLAPSLVTRAVDESQLVTLHGNVHPMARAEYDQGAVATTMPMNHMLLVLKRSPQQETALENLIAQQADQNSPNYHKWLTPAQFGQQFGLSDQDLTAVTTWLGSHGFQVNQVSAGRDMIDFSGNAGEIQEAFHTEIHNFLVNGRMHYANATNPQIPAALAPVVVGVNKLNDFRPQPMHHSVGEFRMTMPGKKVSLVPQYTYTNSVSPCYNGTSTCYVMSPFDFATIYNLPSGWPTSNNGAGVHIAVVSDSDVYAADFNNFRSLMGLPAGTLNKVFALGANYNPGVQDCTANSDEAEAILDAEWAGATAPGAVIDLVEAPSSASNSCANTPSNSGETLPNGYTSGFGGDYAAYWEIQVNPTPDPILSDSYGECELSLGTSGNAFYNSLWQQANTEGIAVITAAGDNGSAGCDYTYPSGTTPAQYGLEVNGTASTPYDVAVGGTDFTYSSPSTAAAYWNSSNSGGNSTLSAKGPIPETVYNDTCTSLQVDSFIGYSNIVNACNSSAASQYGLYIPGGGSGGMSSCTTPSGGGAQDCSGGYAKPTWQTGTGVPADGKRDIPDVSLFAGDGTDSGTYYIACQEDQNPGSAGCALTPQTINGTLTYLFVGEGGTSVSTQAFAGIVADLEQYQGSAFSSVQLNTGFYALAGTPGASNCNNSGSTPLANSSACVFRDITTGTNSMPCETGTANCGSSITSHIVPVGQPWIRFRWTPLGVGMLVCTLCAAMLLFLLPSGRRRWSAALALVLFGVLFGTVSCGGGSGNGTVTGGGGNGNTVGVLSGYNATVGYDRATGLGSINATNLIKAAGW